MSRNKTNTHLLLIFYRSKFFRGKKPWQALLPCRLSLPSLHLPRAPCSEKLLHSSSSEAVAARGSSGGWRQMHSSLFRSIFTPHLSIKFDLQHIFFCVPATLTHSVHPLLKMAWRTCMMKTVAQHFVCREGPLDGRCGGGRAGERRRQLSHSQGRKHSARFSSRILPHPEALVIRAL